MTILTRVTGKVFGSEAPADEIGVFGSAKDGHPTNSPDVATIQSYSNDAYLKGWGSGIVSTQNFPPMEEVTGVLKTISYQTCYALQSGVPIYDAGTEYGAGDIVKVPNGVQLDFYIAQRDATTHDHTPNINKWGDPLFWQKAIIVGDRDIGVPQITLNPVSLPVNYVWLEGQYYLKDDYPTLWSIYGTTYKLSGDTDNTRFRLPDFRNKYICGLSISGDQTDTTMGYVDAGLPDLKLSTSQSGSHHHTGKTGNQNHDHRHTFPKMGSTNDDSPAANYSRVQTGHDAQVGTVSTSVQNASHQHSFTTDDNGSHQHTIISASPFVGSASTVKVDGIKVRVYTRYQ